jgi:hypothetical protein
MQSRCIGDGSKNANYADQPPQAREEVVMGFSRTTLSLAFVILAFAAAGCGEPAEEATLGSMVDEAAAEVQDAAETASDQAVEMADQVKDTLAGKEAELAEISAQIKQLSPEDLMADKGKDLQAKADALMAEIEKLKTE